ncbi:uncharacterized protein LOC106013442 [Aplysia californica]|uniref:Uncharacterized protein LOC106013442 n=1 Tax=Aplysia californica TaxID=6500 RepID=A0ABM1ABR5_APLCA|nr:uncharacterized protein LOC106013442 [Aplysia californica]
MRKDKTVEPKPQPHKRGSNVVIINNELYATSKDVVGAKGGSTAAHTGPEPGTYANHGALQVPDVVYANTPRHPAKVKADVPEENLYANSSQVTNKRGSQSIPAVNSDPNKGRSVSKDGLIYVTVDINPMTSKPEMSRGVAQEESKHDQVDYASLDLLSMSVKNAELKKEGGASGKD